MEATERPRGRRFMIISRVMLALCYTMFLLCLIASCVAPSLREKKFSENITQEQEQWIAQQVSAISPEHQDFARTLLRMGIRKGREK